MNLNSEAYRKQRVHMIKLQNDLIRAGSIPTCTNCEHWDKIKQLCTRWKMLPPAEVIVTGCEEWINEIPF